MLKRGMAINEIIKILVIVVFLALMVFVVIVLFKGEGSSVLDFFKNLLRFGRA